jgi:hypothetical protein
MREREYIECPECRWVAVSDENGRRRLEMRWATPTPPVAAREIRAA